MLSSEKPVYLANTELLSIESCGERTWARN